MRPIYRVVVVLLLILLALPIFPTSIRRLYQTSRYFLQFIPLATHSPTSTAVSSDKPTGLIASSGIELLTFGTPNGQKVKIALEELKAAYGKPYTQQNIPIMQNVQKEPWYTKLSPNGKIPVIVDHDKGGLAVMEGIGEQLLDVPGDHQSSNTSRVTTTQITSSPSPPTPSKRNANNGYLTALVFISRDQV
ncbi:hypothetical protein LTR60_000734 [Cryomyces antarcticus]|nr:hypothetical protein LTR39_000893 [Cryomyces antarcticus]KAK5020202.1 hypothetical protein LTR60_000734 [Cryomyces antarcticus]